MKLLLEDRAINARSTSLAEYGLYKVMLINQRYMELTPTMDALGYNIGEKGICRALTMLWTMATLTEQLDPFYERIKLIGGTENIIGCIEEAQSKGKNLSSEDKKFIDVLAFFDMVRLLQGMFYAEALEKYIFQDSDNEIVLQIATSQELEKKGGLTQLGFSQVVGNAVEIETFLLNLKKTLTDIGEENSKDVVFTISGKNVNGGHATGMRYNSTSDKWIFFNSNQLIELSGKEFTEKEIANEVMNVYGITPKDTTLDNEAQNQVSIDPKANLHIKFFSTGNRKNLEPYFHHITSFINSETICQKLLANDYSFFRVAFDHPVNINNFKNALLTLEKQGFNWNRPDTNGMTIAHHILRDPDSGLFFKTLDLLSNSKIDWSYSDHNGGTPTHYAIGSSNYEALEWLMNSLKEWNKPDKQSITPAKTAIQNGNIHAMELMSSKVDWGQVLPGQNTYAHYAAHCDKASVLEFLMSKGIDLSVSNTHRITPKELAGIEDKRHAYQFLIKHIPIFTENETNIPSEKKEGTFSINVLAALSIDDWNKRDQDGNTPAHYLMKNVDEHTLEFVSDAKISNWDIKNNQGKAPVHILLESTLEASLCPNFDEDSESNSKLQIMKDMLKWFFKNGVDLLAVADYLGDSDATDIVTGIIEGCSKENYFYSTLKGEEERLPEQLQISNVNLEKMNQFKTRLNALISRDKSEEDFNCKVPMTIGIS